MQQWSRLKGLYPLRYNRTWPQRRTTTDEQWEQWSKEVQIQGLL
jgi:hypothetical protein